MRWLREFGFKTTQLTHAKVSLAVPIHLGPLFGEVAQAVEDRLILLLKQRMLDL